MTPEAELKAEVVQALKTMGVFYLRINSGIVKVRGAYMHLAPEGTADILVFPAGRVVWIELKARGQVTAKKRLEAQAAFRTRVLDAGHEHAICYSAEEVMGLVMR